MTIEQLIRRRCRPCSGEASPLSRESARSYLGSLPDWSLSADAKSLSRDWAMRDFAAAVELVDEIARIAEAEDHHPDIHLTGYRNLRVELSTHSIGGLSENDFILAAKIETLPKRLKA
ncbi:MAG: 4a-hydroxytetrahydrobiopterin dehydratase [Elusimicrobia bacterium]|nr:4a-hydroxytetrahydrobiopterin dehydratase [Elusimicrobiota bacterium]